MTSDTTGFREEVRFLLIRSVRAVWKWEKHTHKLLHCWDEMVSHPPSMASCFLRFSSLTTASRETCLVNVDCSVSKRASWACWAGRHHVGGDDGGRFLHELTTELTFKQAWAQVGFDEVSPAMQVGLAGEGRSRWLASLRQRRTRVHSLFSQPPPRALPPAEPLLPPPHPTGELSLSSGTAV